MTLAELDRALRQLRLSGMATALEARLRQAQAERLAPLDLVAALVTDELVRRQDRLLERPRTHARFRDPGKTLDTFDFDFNKKMDRARVFELEEVLGPRWLELAHTEIVDDEQRDGGEVGHFLAAGAMLAS